ncbi:hypothetical protein MMC25_002111 [Agyrium rufum]|nr:hypothetical protein [Agyrium rufum]
MDESEQSKRPRRDVTALAQDALEVLEEVDCLPGSLYMAESQTLLPSDGEIATQSYYKREQHDMQGILGALQRGHVPWSPKQWTEAKANKFGFPRLGDKMIEYEEEALVDDGTKKKTDCLQPNLTGKAVVKTISWTGECGQRHSFEMVPGRAILTKQIYEWRISGEGWNEWHGLWWKKTSYRVSLTDS